MKSSITPTLAHPLMSNFFNSEEEPVLTHWLHHGFVCECIQNTNNSTTYSCPPSPRKEEINSVCTYMHVSVSVYVCVCACACLCVCTVWKGEHHLLWSYCSSVFSCAVHLYFILSLALSLPSPPFLSAFLHLSTFVFCFLCSPLPFSSLLISLRHLNLSHSCSCHRNLKIGRCTQAEYNTTAASHLHHWHDNVKLETHHLT